MSVNYARSKLIDFTRSVGYTSFTVIYPKPSVGPNWKGPIQPFSLEVSFIGCFQYIRLILYLSGQPQLLGDLKGRRKLYCNK